MNTSGTFSAPCRCTDIPPGAKVLCAQPAFKIQDIDFDVSYSPTSAFDNIRMIIAIAAAESMIIYGLDMSNAFQTNIEEKPYERVYDSIPLFYLEYLLESGPIILCSEHLLMSYASK
eukprot:14651818-Ditylum_brightwellii.AAC.1